MNRFTAASAALLASTALAQAGGIERNAFTTAILFEQGTYVELGYSFVSPDVSGVQQATASATSLAGTPSGGVAPSYGFATLSFATAINDRLTAALVYDAPVGADVAYAPGPYVFAGSEAELRSQQVTAALRYELTDNISVFGGLRAARVSGDAYVTTTSFSYLLDDAQSDTGFGYMLGAAYEIPDIALRVALTYFSEIDLDLTSREALVGAAGIPASALAAGAVPSSFGITLPDSVLLEAQTGVAEGTLVFGSVRWVDWSEFTITPNFYPAAGGGVGGDLAFYRGDSITYTLGGARVLNDNWTVLGSLLYEEGNGGFVGNLGPTDGRTALSLGARYTNGPIVISGGLQYSWIGDAQTAFGPLQPVASFTDNTALSASIRFGYRF
ncbi:OmpP1/FadL family transporter [Roseicyclus mahoneyensis]|uniref:Long-subunit fatty acid transport protein n=1 Tax=Roseicyclus mahoneyensis TaxID=164332 RepID=A0A316GRG7_9RHOB|nr:outer membrane protein transport protein [Roseicyclus mahoneyensis]PWK62622.1 long-subunit fatty acid transport protein [Roseicyclus mahoneyensis]